MWRAGLHAPLLKPPVAQLCFTAFCKLPAEVQPVLPGGVGEGAAVAHGAAALLLHGDAGNAGVPAVDGRGERTSVIACTVQRSACVGKSAAAARQAHRRQVLRRARQDSVGGLGVGEGLAGEGGRGERCGCSHADLRRRSRGASTKGPGPRPGRRRPGGRAGDSRILAGVPPGGALARVGVGAGSPVVGVALAAGGHLEGAVQGVGAGE